MTTVELTDSVDDVGGIQGQVPWKRIFEMLTMTPFETIDYVYYLLYLILNYPDELEPRYDETVEEYSSPVAERLKRELGLTEYRVRVLMTTLETLGGLKKTVFTRKIECPRSSEHGPSRMITEYHCIFCGSFNLEKSRVIQHVACGFTGLESQFKRDESGNIVCPYCGVPLFRENEDYRVLKAAYYCLECGKINVMPKILHRCLKCGGLYDYREVNYKPLHKIEPGPFAEALYKNKEFILYGIARYFEEKNYKVKYGVKVKGIALIEYRVDLQIIKTKTNRLTVDVIDSMPGMSFKAKISTVNPLTYKIILTPAVDAEVFFKEFPDAKKLTFQVKNRLREAAEWLEEQLNVSPEQE